MTQRDYKYWAFISYSHADEAWAKWLHKAIETYPVPRRLVGHAHPDGTIPRRLFPVFRDRDELASSAELGAVINRALEDSRYQIVICSPRSAASRWVNEEIRTFKSLGRESRVLALIVEGEPHAADPAQECFAPALKWRVLTDGRLGDEAVEPIAADARAGRDGRDGALLKLLAGMLDVGYDELVQRERRRRWWDRAAKLGAAAALVVAIAGAWFAFDRYRTEQALQYRITELYQSGRRELLAHNEARAAVLLNEVYKLGVDTPALRYMLGRAMRVVDAQRLRFQTGSPVLVVELSPDGTRLFTIGADWHLRLWDALDGARLAEVDLGDVNQAAATFSRLGSWISVETDHDSPPTPRLRLLNGQTGELRLEALLAAHVGVATQQLVDRSDRFLTYVRPDRRLARIDLLDGAEAAIEGRYTTSTFCRDETAILAGRYDGSVLRIDRHSGSVLQTYSGLGGPVATIDSSDSCRTIAAATAAGAFRIWETASGNPLLIGGDQHGIAELRLSADGARLMSLSLKGVSLWDGRSGRLVYSTRFQDPSSPQAAVSPDGKSLATMDNSQLALVEPDSGAELYTFDNHLGVAQAFNFAPDGRHFVCGGSDGTVAVSRLVQRTLADIAQGRAVPDNRETQPAAVAFSTDAKWFFAGGQDGGGAVWDRDDQRQRFAVGGHRSAIVAAAFSADGQWLASGSDDGEIRIWDARSGALQRQLPSRAGGLRLLEFSPAGSILAAQFRDGRLQLWEVRSGESLAALVADTRRAGSFSPDGSAYAYGADGVAQVWDLSGRELRWQAALPADAAIDPGLGVVQYSPDGQRLLATLKSGTAWLLDARDGRILQLMTEPSSSFFNAGGFSPDGRRVVLADSSKLALVWEPATGRRLSLRGHAAAVRAAGFNNDGTLMFSGGDDGTVKIWDGFTGEMLDSFAAHDGSMATGSLRFSSDGRSILTGGTDHHVRLWSVARETRSPARISQLLRCRVGWVLEDLRLRPVMPDAQNCLPQEQAQSLR